MEGQGEECFKGVRYLQWLRIMGVISPNWDNEGYNMIRVYTFKRYVKDMMVLLS